jgi:hypothetical protein
VKFTSLIPTSSVPTHADCRYCSVVSKTHGVDPIGSASQVNEWLFVEVPRPWTKHLWADKPDYQLLLQQVEKLAAQPERYLKTRLLAIAPDKHQSQPDRIRIFYYVRPAPSFSQYAKQEYLVPLTEAAALVEALLYQPHRLEQWRCDRQATDPVRDLFICTHTHHDVACGRFGTPFYQLLKQQSVPASNGTLRVWQTNHFGGHQFAPTLIDFPQGQFWGNLEPKMLDGLIDRQGSVSDLRSYYRGWAGLSKFEQIVEREVWQQEGWDWLTYGKTGRLSSWDEKHLWRWLARRVLQWFPSQRVQRLLSLWQQEATWATIEIAFVRPNGSTGTYTARVEAVRTVETKLKSGEQVPLKLVPQYLVSDLRQHD